MPPIRGLPWTELSRRRCQYECIIMTGSHRKCPICGKPRHAEHTPFCSPRCRDRDLVQWLEDGYALPGPAAAPELPDED